MRHDEGVPVASGLAERYLADVAALLADADPAFRAEVLAGVRDHLQAALGAPPWPESEVRAALAELGPPEEIARVTLDQPDAGRLQPGRPAAPHPAPGGAPSGTVPLLSRPWVPPVATTLIAVGLIPALLLTARFATGTGIGGAALPFTALLLGPFGPLMLVGALLVSISPLYSTADRVAAWLVVPWCAAVVAVTNVSIGAAEPCFAGYCGDAFDRQVAAAATVGSRLLMGLGVVAVLVRVGAVRRTRSGDWWRAVAVGLGLLLSALPVALLPLTYRLGTYLSRTSGGVVAYPGTLGDVLTPVLMVAPVWVATVVLLVRSSTWGRVAKGVAIASVPVALMAAVAVCAVPDVLSPRVLAAGSAVALGTGLAVGVVVAGLWALAVRRARLGSVSAVPVAA